VKIVRVYNVGGHTRSPDIAHLWKSRDFPACLRYSILSIEGAERVIGLFKPGALTR
jgi:hypothetical protein